MSLLLGERDNWNTSADLDLTRSLCLLSSLVMRVKPTRPSISSEARLGRSCSPVSNRAARWSLRSHRPQRRQQSGGTYEHASCSCTRSEEHTSELQSLMRISYAVFCLQKN